ncbi:type II secretion system F family protein [Acetobacterium woodii]|uniref:Type IV fimbrial assembly protein PilC n=1 Tax=Acetobacterium woodii (strain ATCC 29683 / DSM 1030 / JCM 2381 / KCTC 1655 / WB1) TaxID=931626 RepID=H6LFR7_ACEWD|nr:type II secretion system F family protein [Acetobacterium woodii]AFA47012.1 type IV fimbrial assembly protein PilC [Acetobacterium woodii DSM 1030]
MPVYQYTAKNLQSEVIRGTMEASTPDVVRRNLRQKNEFALKIQEVNEHKQVYKLKPMEISDFSRQIASMLAAGITMIRAISIIEERDIKPKIKKVYEKLHTEVENGNTLSHAMEQTGGSFPELLINMYKSGEASGQMEETARKMAEHYEKEHKLRTKIKGAMTYPMILFVVTVIVVLVVFTLILPQFFTLFEGIELPAITRLMINISTSMTSFWYLYVIGLLAIIAMVAFLLSLPTVKRAVDQLKLRIPRIGKLMKTIYTARFSRTLSSLYSSGLAMINALEISGSIIGNTYLQNQFPHVIEQVRNGEPLSASIQSINGFDSKLVSTIYIGEESGNLDEMLNNVADSFDYEAEMATTRLVAFIEPIMIIIMAVMVGGIMLSVMLPIMTLYQNIG